jgi:D-sedoheptulose 7-phosphate isomerase
MKEPGDAQLWSGASEHFQRHIEASIATKQKLLASCQAKMLEAAVALTAALASGGKILLCGNGGSAADCQHIASEFVNVLSQRFPRPGLAAISLTTDTSMLTSSANDFGFAGVFERQAQALGREGDALIAISTSGNSENVLRAVRYANEHGIATIGLTGSAACKLASEARIAICAPSAVTAHIQESHIAIGHMLCAVVERSLYPAGSWLEVHDRGE